MPYREPDPDDPNVLMRVSAPGGKEAVRERAIAFAEEFAALGLSEARLLSLFLLPYYAAAHYAYQVLGEDEIRRIIGESLELWGRFRGTVKEPPADRARRSPRLVKIGPDGRGPVPRRRAD